MLYTYRYVTQFFLDELFLKKLPITLSISPIPNPCQKVILTAPKIPTIIQFHNHIISNPLKSAPANIQRRINKMPINHPDFIYTSFPLAHLGKYLIVY